ncbi:MAG: hypothetical protein VX768_02820 [Planctomycetota bacterium]|nr:hypothetical protein [Planctomycetota bacterium]
MDEFSPQRFWGWNWFFWPKKTGLESFSAWSNKKHRFSWTQTNHLLIAFDEFHKNHSVFCTSTKTTMQKKAPQTISETGKFADTLRKCQNRENRETRADESSPPAKCPVESHLEAFTRQSRDIVKPNQDI